MKRVGVLTAGGDVQALNAAISAFTKTAINSGYEVLGFKKGWEGILNPPMFEILTKETVSGLTHIGGTILKATNKGRFAGKVGSGDVNHIPDEILDMAVENLNKLGVHALAVIGGDGTMTAALQLARKGVNIIGIPKTIDNDLKHTDKTFGFSTAIDVIVQTLDRIHTTATSHERVFLLEVMGRHTGWLALYGGFAGGADAILIPEIKFSYQHLLERIRKRDSIGKTSTVILVAEGASAIEEDVYIQKGIEKSEVQLGGISFEIMQKIKQMAPDEFDLRNTVLGHSQRGGSPNAEDRMLAKAFGIAATEAIKRGDFGKMLSLNGTDITTIPLENSVEKLKAVKFDDYIFKAAQRIGIFLGTNEVSEYYD